MHYAMHAPFPRKEFFSQLISASSVDPAAWSSCGQLDASGSIQQPCPPGSPPLHPPPHSKDWRKMAMVDQQNLTSDAAEIQLFKQDKGQWANQKLLELFLNPQRKKMLIFCTVWLTVPRHHLEMDMVSFHLVGTVRIKYFGSQMSAWLVNNAASHFLLMLKYCKTLPRRLFSAPVCLGILEPCSFTCAQWMTLSLSFCSVADKLHSF